MQDIGIRLGIDQIAGGNIVPLRILHQANAGKPLVDPVRRSLSERGYHHKGLFLRRRQGKGRCGFIAVVRKPLLIQGLQLIFRHRRKLLGRNPQAFGQLLKKPSQILL